MEVRLLFATAPLRVGQFAPQARQLALLGLDDIPLPHELGSERV